MKKAFTTHHHSLSTSSTIRSSDHNYSVNYFNADYSENSESPRTATETPRDKSDIHELTAPNRLSRFVCKEPRNPLTQGFMHPMRERPAMVESTFKEKSLAEIGFDSTEIAQWDKIVQPHKADLMELLERMIKNYEKTNVQITIGDTTFNCHLMVLQCYSDFFMELTNEQVVVLPADKVTPEAFVMVYDWMLSSKPLVQREGILELFNAAQFLKIKGLVDQCWVCLDDDERFCEDAAFLLYLEARKFGHELIQQLMLTRICKFFLTLVASKEFLELTSKEIYTLLQSNSIGVNSETEVFMSAVRWLNYNWKDREKDLLEVMKCIRFGLMTPWQLVELRRNADSPEVLKVTTSSDVQKMLDDGLSYVTTKYWYANNSENLVHLMERLQLQEPVERQWIRDKMFKDNFECPNQLYTSYSKFLEYLEVIRKMGKDHWKSLECHEGCPNMVFQGQTISASGDQKGIQNNLAAILGHTDKS